MLDSFYQLGKIQTDTIASLLSPISSIKHVIGIIFRVDNNNTNNKISYESVNLYEFANNELYLWKRDYSGRPGLFLTGKISPDDIKKVKTVYQKSNDPNNKFVQKFIRNKILWFPNGKIVTNKKILRNMDADIKKELFGILEEFKKNNKISMDVLHILTNDEPERVLLTVMIKRDESSIPLFVGEIDSYVELFKQGVLSKKLGLITEAQCCICNNKRPIGSFNEKSLPFYVGNKAMHFPSADPLQEYKSFPLCDYCFLDIQKGLFFIQEKLDFHIPSINSNKSNLSFWLISHLNESELLIAFKNDLENKNLYLNSLKDLCSTLKIISKRDSHERERESIEAFLRFSGLFYNTDDNGHMRVISYIQGIYPTRLQELFEFKEKIEKKYPFSVLSQKINNMLIGFPLLVFFYEGIRSQWKNAVISILEKMFKAEHIDIEEIINTLLYKIRELYNDAKKTKNFSFDYLSKTIFQGLMLLEYIISLNKQRVDMIDEVDDSITQPTPIIKDIESIQKFISSHNNILTRPIERAIFGIGICTGILLEIQSQRYKKTAPFWNRINRFDLDINKIISLFNEIKSKLVMYGEHNYDTVINYLGVNEIISLLDLSSSQNISREKINFIFSIGLSYGYMLKRGFL